MAKHGHVKEVKGLGGMLIVYILCLVLFLIFLFQTALVNLISSALSYFRNGYYVGMLILCICFGAYIVYTIIQMVHHKPNAVPLAKRTAIGILAFWLFGTIGYFREVGFDMDVLVAMSFFILIQLAFIMYLQFSKKVNEVFPVNIRHVHHADDTMILIIGVLMVAFLAVW
jgi:hypothetical protein